MSKKWIALLLVLVMLASPALAEVQATLTQKIATRSGPGTAYDEPGTFFINTWKNQTVRVLSRAEGSGVWWVLIEFSEDGKLYRAYTGAKRVNVSLDAVPVEAPLGAGSMIAAGAVTGRYGPGEQYAATKYDVPWSADVVVYAAENGYLLVDFFDPAVNRQRRAWVFGELAQVNWYGAPPAGSLAAGQAGIADGSLFASADPAATCLVRHYGETGGFTVMDLAVAGYPALEYLVAVMEGRDYGAFHLADGRGGEVWFYADQDVVDAYLTDYGLTGTLILTR